jgi:hypothetical protein
VLEARPVPPIVVFEGFVGFDVFGFQGVVVVVDGRWPGNH